jgi:predicted DNA-binding WGR domain protein
MRRFEFREGKSSKFWQIEVGDASFTVTFGRIGTEGQTQKKAWPSAAAAQAAADKLISEKTGKGYVEIASAKTAPPKPVAPKSARPPAAKSPPKHGPAPQGLPSVLVNPPWLLGTTAAAPAVLELSTLARPTTLVWEKGERERNAGRSWADSKAEIDRQFKEIEKKVKEYPGRAITPYVDSYWHAVRFTDAALLKAWRTFPRVLWRSNTAPLLLARLGDKILPEFIDYAVSLRHPTTAKVLGPVVGPAVAPIMAEGFASARSRADAEKWLRAHPEMAAVGLIPVALGKTKARENAAAALRFLADKGHRETIRSVADEYGDAARQALDALLGADQARALPATLPVLPSFFKAKALVAPLLKGAGTKLPPEALEHLGTMLAFSAPAAPYVGLAEVRAACEPASLEDFAWTLYEAWMKAGAPAKEQWAFLALGHLGGDAGARRITPLIRAWPGQGFHDRSALGLEVLARIGTDVALMNLHSIAQKVKFKALQDKAAAKIAEIAESRGLTPDELADRLVPDLDLDADGSRAIDYGARRFVVGFDEQLRPYIEDESRKRLSDLPKPGKGDDAAKAKVAMEQWQTLKKDARAIAAGQILRLELAMCGRRRWDVATFRTFLVEHPVITHLVRRLVWATYGADQRVTAFFRVAEDRTYADVHDDTFRLDPTACVGIPHALEIDAATAEVWGRLLADYEIVPPFAQLGRPTFALGRDEGGKREIARAKGGRVISRKVLTLLERGWRKGPPQDNGFIWWFDRPIPGQESARLFFSPGLDVSGQYTDPEQELGLLKLPVPARELDPITFSELISDVMALRA